MKSKKEFKTIKRWQNNCMNRCKYIWILGAKMVHQMKLLFQLSHFEKNILILIMISQ